MHSFNILAWSVSVCHHHATKSSNPTRGNSLPSYKSVSFNYSRGFSLMTVIKYCGAGIWMMEGYWTCILVGHLWLPVIYIFIFFKYLNWKKNIKICHSETFNPKKKNWQKCSFLHICGHLWCFWNCFTALNLFPNMLSVVLNTWKSNSFVRSSFVKIRSVAFASSLLTDEQREKPPSSNPQQQCFTYKVGPCHTGSY